MSQEQKKADVLEDMFYKLKPTSRYASQQHVEQYTDSIYKQIINGDIEVSKQKAKIEENPNRKQIEEMVRKRFLSQAQRQKEDLSHRLDYVSHSINALKKYEDLKRINSKKALSATRSLDESQFKQQWREKVKHRGQKLQKLKEEAQKKRVQKQQQMKEKQTQVKKEEKEKRRKQLMQNLKEIQNRVNKRQQNKKEENQRYLSVKRQKRMFQRLSESFQVREETFLQERKKKLAQIRNLYQPIDEEEIYEHEKKFLQYKRQKQEMRQKQKRMNESRSRSYKPMFKSQFYKEIEESMKEQDDSAQIKFQKMKQFSQHVKEKFKPQIDERKRQEVLDFMTREKRQEEQRINKEKQLLFKSQKKGLQYLKRVRDIPKKKKRESLGDLTHKSDRIQYDNYITHVRVGQEKPWSKILQSSDDKQLKALHLQFESQKTEQQLKRRELQVKVMKRGDTGEIDEEYYRMIKAKLDLLQMK